MVGSRSRLRAWVGVLATMFVAATSLAGCACSPEEEKRKTTRRTTEGGSTDFEFDDDETEPQMSTPEGPDRAADPDDPARLIYLISRTNELYSFNPKIGGRAAYHLVGKIDCKTRGTPQSMAVDRLGWAWVFFDSRELFKVNIRDASCSPKIDYRHPTGHPQLGMGFTSVAPGVAQERLFIMSPAFGLATIEPDLRVAKTGKLVHGAELTGGGDARLFQYEAEVRLLSEIDLSSFAVKPIHRFGNLVDVHAWAFARYAGRFYLFTSTGFTPSRTTEYDPKTNVESVRDTDIGFTVVGAGQSILAPPPDKSTEIKGDFPNE